MLFNPSELRLTDQRWWKVSLCGMFNRDSHHTRGSLVINSCVAKIGFTYLNIIKTENRRKSLIDFFEIERLCLFLATLFFPIFTVSSLSRKEKWRHFLISASVLASKTTQTQRRRGCLSLQWTTTRSTLSVYLALPVSQVGEWGTVVFSKLKGMGHDLWLQV